MKPLLPPTHKIKNPRSLYRGCHVAVLHQERREVNGFMKNYCRVQTGEGKVFWTLLHHLEPLQK